MYEKTGIFYNCVVTPRRLTPRTIDYSTLAQVWPCPDFHATPHSVRQLLALSIFPAAA